MLTGSLGTALGLIFAGLSKRIWQLYLAQGILFGFSLGWVFIPAVPLMGQWFDKRR